jgi:murein DD-endopeptidase MepM/ murein hydrolase activator NlpD
VVAAALSLAAAAEPTQNTGAAARATAVRVIVPGQPGAAIGAVSAPPDAVAFGDGFAYPADGTIVRTGSVTASVSTVAEATATARASTDVTSIVLFNGEITVDSVAVRAKAAASPTAAAGDFSGSTLTNLVALGGALTPGPNARFPLADWGYLVTLEQASVPGEPEGGRSHADSISGLVVRLTADHGGLPAGSEILVGYAQTTAEAKAPPPAVTVAKPTPSPKPSEGPKVLQPITKLPPRKKAPDPERRPPGLSPVQAPPDVDAKLTPGRYVFPVYGASGYGDTYGAPRATVTWHHGIDIFAPLGAPLLAVTDGIVYSVGWNDIGGNRLWLRDTRGNEYYYAHLSAFSPLAVNGAIVRAGDVLGFVGQTGDAEGTPYHLHFEIHPRELLHMGYDGVINPYPYLNAWQRVADLRFPAFANGFVPRVSAVGNAPQPGAILLHASDISTASGLDPGALEAALGSPAPAGAETPTYRTPSRSGR